MALQHFDHVLLERHIQQRRHLASDAEDRLKMGEWPFNVELQDSVAHIVDQWCTHGRIIGQIDDVHLLLGETQFLLRADHSPRWYAANLGLLQLDDALALGVAIVETGSLQREGNLQVQITLPAVVQQAGGPGDDELGLRATVHHLGQDQSVGVGMGTDGAHLADDDLIRVPGQFGLRQADVLDGLHLQPGQRQSLGQLLDGDRDIHVVSKPRNRYFHCVLLGQTVCRYRSSELPQEPQVVSIEQADVVNAIFDHRRPLDAKAECEAAPLVGVVAAILEHDRVHHPRSAHLQPAGVLAHPATIAMAQDAVHIGLNAGLGEGEVGATNANAALRSIQPPRKTGQRADQVGHGDAVSDCQSLHLVELMLRASGDLLVTVALAGQDDADRLRMVITHSPDLPW